MDQNLEAADLRLDPWTKALFSEEFLMNCQRNSYLNLWLSNLLKTIIFEHYFLNSLGYH